jgi:hypothetical protein
MRSLLVNGLLTSPRVSAELHPTFECRRTDQGVTERVVRCTLLTLILLPDADGPPPSGLPGAMQRTSPDI